jgi:outer membrane protein OmpA-like peptidoglycan-associated protein
MKKILIAIAGIAAATFSTGALAQNLWDGPEVGIQGGYGWGTSKGSIASGLLNYSFSPDGGLGGAHAGFNWQWDHVVLGVEGDVEGGDVSGTLNGTFTRFAGNVHSSMDFDASIRGKLGWAFDRVLVYGTGGVAFGDVNTRFTATTPPIGNVGSVNGVRVGWTGGGGLAYAITPNWELGAEYRYTDLGSKNVTFPLAGVTGTNSFTYSAVRAVLTYRFAPPPPAPPMAPMPAAAPAPAPMPMARTFLVFFDFDRYNLTPDARRVIDAAAGVYKVGGHARIDVSGYTDLAGTQAYNLRLSQRRADAVAAYLARQGVPKNVMDVKWFGKEHPRVPTADGVREPQNRRVEIVMP